MNNDVFVIGAGPAGLTAFAPHEVQPRIVARATRRTACSTWWRLPTVHPSFKTEKSQLR